MNMITMITEYENLDRITVISLFGLKIFKRVDKDYLTVVANIRGC